MKLNVFARARVYGLSSSAACGKWLCGLSFRPHVGVRFSPHVLPHVAMRSVVDHTWVCGPPRRPHVGVRFILSAARVYAAYLIGRMWQYVVHVQFPSFHIFLWHSNGWYV